MRSSSGDEEVVRLWDIWKSKLIGSKFSKKVRGERGWDCGGLYKGF